MWAEPCLIEAAREEYDGVLEEFLATGERLFGPYIWGRCGVTSTSVPFIHRAPGFPLSPSPGTGPPGPGREGEKERRGGGEGRGGEKPGLVTAAEEGAGVKAVGAKSCLTVG